MPHGGKANFQTQDPLSRYKRAYVEEAFKLFKMNKRVLLVKRHFVTLLKRQKSRNVRECYLSSAKIMLLCLL